MKKIVVMVAFCLLGIALFAQTSDVLSLEDAIALHKGKEDIESIKVLLAEGINVANPDKYGYTPLMYASRNGYTAIIKALIAEGADIETKNDYDWTALMEAAQKGETEAVKVLIEAGADVDAKDNEDDTALIKATWRGYTEIVKALIEAGADLDIKDMFNDTALLIAAEDGNAEIITLLVKGGANIEAKDGGGNTALSRAVSYNKINAIKTLIALGTNLNTRQQYGYSVLMEAAWDDEAKIVTILIKAGANIEAKSDTNRTALTEAARNGHTKIVTLLINAGANIDAQGYGGDTALMNANRRGHTGVVYLLTEAAKRIKGTVHNYYKIPYVGETSILTKRSDDEKSSIIKKYNFPTTVNDFLNDGNSITGKLESVYREDIPNENGKTTLSVYRLMYTLSASGSNGIAKLSFIEDEGTERQSYGQAIYILNSNKTKAELFSRDIYFGSQDLSSSSSLSVIGNNTYFKVIDTTIISVRYTLQSSPNQTEDNKHEAILYRNEIENMQDKTVFCQVEASFPLIDKNNPYRYTIQNAFDGNPATSYVEDTNNDLMTIAFEFPTDYTFTHIAMINGYAQSENLYYFNNRVKRINFPETSTANENSYNLDGNTLEYQAFTLEKPITQSSASIDVTQIYEGTKYSDTSLAELDIKTEDGWLFGFRSSLFIQIGNVLRLQDAIALYKDDETKTSNGDRVIEIIDDLVFEGIDATDSEHGSYYSYDTPLMYASAYGYTEIAKSLIAAGADINEGDSNNVTPLMMAANNEIAKALIDAGAWIDADDEYHWTALMQAAGKGHTERVKLLIEAGADLELATHYQDNHGRTALMRAAGKGHTEVVKLFIKAGANLEAKDQDGITALGWAARREHAETVNVLKAAGASE